MKLKFFIAGVAIVAGLASAVSCQDLTKDLTDLKSKVASLESTVQSLQAKIDAGSVITSVTPTNSGIVITLSNGNKYEITNGVNGKDGTNGKDGQNGKDGKDGSVVTIGENGNWFIDGQDTGLAAKGKDGAPGANGKDGQNGEFYVPNPETGCFDKYTWDEETKGYVVTPTEISFLAPGTITAVYDPESGILTLYGVDGGEGEQGIVTIYGKATIASISLVEAFSGYLNGSTTIRPQGHEMAYWGDEINCNFVTVTEKTNTFGPNKEMEFVAGTQVNRPVSIVVRVSPANAELNAEDICFTNSQGTVFDQVEVVSIEPYTDLLTKASTETGLYVVTVALSEYNEKAFNAATVYKKKPIAFAMKAGDAVSTYDLSFSHSNYVPESGLDFLVTPDFQNFDPVAGLNNRFKGNYGAKENPSLPMGGNPAYEELIWAPYKPSQPTPATAPTKDNIVMNPASDDRHDKALYQANMNEPIIVYPYNTVDDEEMDIKGLYIALDKEANAVESAPSEWNAWNSYAIAGLNTVYDYELGFATISITDDRANGDIIGFRVYAVNWDGTLVDPDGRAFYVQVGDPGESWGTVATKMSTPADYLVKKQADAKVFASDKVGITTTKLNVNYTIEFNVDANQMPFALVLLNKDGGYLKTLKSGESVSATTTDDTYGLTKDTPIWKKIMTYPCAADGSQDGPFNYRNYKDGKTYTGTVTVTETGTGRVLATMKVSYTKELPTTAPAGFSVKTAQVEDGIYNCYLVPDEWAAEEASEGTMKLDNVFNFTKDAADVKDQFTTTFAASTNDGKDPVKVVGGNTLTIAKGYINNTTKHATSVSFSYGDMISSETYKKDIDTGVVTWYDYVIKDVVTFDTIYNCIYNNTYAWNWNWGENAAEPSAAIDYAYNYVWSEQIAAKQVVEVVPAAENEPIRIVYEEFDGEEIALSYIDGVSGWDSEYNATLDEPYKESLSVKSAKLVSNSNGVEEYYTVEVATERINTSTNPWRPVWVEVQVLQFTKQSSATNPTAAVPSTLIIACKDMYGHDVAVKLDVKVMPRK